MKIRKLFRLFFSITATLLCMSVMANAREHRLIEAIPEPAPAVETAVLSAEESETPVKTDMQDKNLQNPKNHKAIFMPMMRWLMALKDLTPKSSSIAEAKAKLHKMR